MSRIRHVNTFADLRGSFVPPFWVQKQGGLRTGPFCELVMLALSSVDHLDLGTSYHDERTYGLYMKDRHPGLVSGRPSLLFGRRTSFSPVTVRWKSFKRWVHANAARLVQTKSEVRNELLAYQREMSEDLRNAIEADMEAFDDDRDDFDISGDLDWDDEQSPLDHLYYDES